MSPSTAHGYPYPSGTDRVADGDEVIRDLATAVDTKLGTWAAGVITAPIITAATAATVVVTFPAGRFVAAPVVMTTPLTTAAGACRSCVDNITTTGAAIRGARDTNVTPFDVMWWAVQAP